MSIENFLNYKAYIELQNKQLQVWGQPCTIYAPKNITNLGYENVKISEVEAMNSDEILANSYDKYESRIWINFNPSKSVFYKFNYFPDDADELSTAFMKSNSFTRENAYIRTAVPGQTSIWGTWFLKFANYLTMGLVKH